MALSIVPPAGDSTPDDTEPKKLDPAVPKAEIEEALKTPVRPGYTMGPAALFGLEKDK